MYWSKEKIQNQVDLTFGLTLNIICKINVRYVLVWRYRSCSVGCQTKLLVRKYFPIESNLVSLIE